MWNFYEKTGNLNVDLNNFKDYLKDDYKSHKLISSNDGEDVILVHVSEEDNKKRIYHGKIYIITIQGVVSVLAYECLDYCKKTIIHNIQPYCLEQYYSRGIGSRLIEFMIEIAIDKGWTMLEGSLSESDIKDHKERLIPLYINRGFTIEGNKIFRYI